MGRAALEVIGIVAVVIFIAGVIGGAIGAAEGRSDACRAAFVLADSAADTVYVTTRVPDCAFVLRLETSDDP